MVCIFPPLNSLLKSNILMTKWRLLHRRHGLWVNSQITHVTLLIILMGWPFYIESGKHIVTVLERKLHIHLTNIWLLHYMTTDHEKHDSYTSSLKDDHYGSNRNASCLKKLFSTVQSLHAHCIILSSCPVKFHNNQWNANVYHLFISE